MKKVLVTGSSGFVGSALLPLLEESGYQVYTLVRSKELVSESAIFWNPEKGELDKDQIEDFYGVIHLAGETIMGLWTPAKKQRIRDSRVISTRLLSDSFKHISKPPEVFLSASAIGIYGDRPDEELDENSEPGEGFLVDVGKEWEAAANAATELGTRVVNLRIGIVMGEGGGALQKMLTPFKLGIGGRLGSGKQVTSWIALEDLASIILFALHNERISGPINCTAPHPVTNLELTKALSSKLQKPAIIPAPELALNLLPGNFAKETLLSSAHCYPAKVLDNGYQFQFPKLEQVLDRLS